MSRFRTSLILIVMFILQSCSSLEKFNPADYVDPNLSTVNATGRKFVIKTKGNGADTYYIQSASLNGKLHQSCRIPNSEIFKGGKLVLEMGTEPNEKWGK